MKKIEKIVIACYKYDLDWLKVCVASVRYWYPEIPIYILKDSLHGSFNTKEVEKAFNVKIYKTERKKFGWGVSKIEILIEEKNDKVLILDTDTVFVGYVLDYLNKFDEDFLLSGHEDVNSRGRLIKRDYIDTERTVDEIDANYAYPGFGFNSGHVIFTGGNFKREDFQNLIDYNEVPPKLMYPEILPYADQGIMNYVFSKKLQNGNCTARHLDFYYWSDLEFVKHEIDLNSIKNRIGYNGIIHWAGTKTFMISKLTRNDIYRFYENYYYSKIKFGLLKKRLILIKKVTLFGIKKFKNKLK